MNGLTLRRRLDIPEIVRDDNDTAGEGVDGICKGVDGGNIKTVGRLVKKKHVGALDGQESKDDSGLLTLGKGSHEGSLSLTSETVLAELLSPVLDILRDCGMLGANKVEGRLCQVKLLGRVLRVHAELQVRVARNDTRGGRNLAGEDAEKSRLAYTVGADKGGTGIHVDTKIKVLVQVVVLLPRVGEGDIVKSQDRWGQLLDIGEAESEGLVLGDGLDETVGLHLVEDLLPGLGLADQVGVGTGRGDELLDVLDFLLLLLIGLHLVDLLLVTCLGVSVVVTTVVEKLLHAHVDHVCADTIEEIHRVGDEDKCAVPLLEVLFEPDTGLEIQMCCRVVEQEQRRLDEKRLGEGDTHTPATRHVLCLLVDGLLVEAETGENEGCASLEG